MSVYHAFSAIDDAIERTKSLLWPFKWSVWWRIAVICLFTGGFGGFNFPSSFPGNPPSDLSGLEAGFWDIPELIIFLLVAVGLIALVYLYFSNVFQFVFVKCLAENQFRLRKFFRENAGRGFRLFIFMIIMIFLVIAAVAVFLLSIFSSGGSFDPILFMAALGFFLLVILAVSIISIFTIDFVVPIMLKDNCGVIEGWKKCFSIVKESPAQSIIYLIMKVVISIVVAIFLLLASMIVIIAVGIPFLILYLLMGIGLGLNLLNVVVLVLFLAIIIPVLLIISVPFSTFLRVYSLAVLEKLNSGYRLME